MNILVKSNFYCRKKYRYVKRNRLFASDSLALSTGPLSGLYFCISNSAFSMNELGNKIKSLGGILTNKV